MTGSTSSFSASTSGVMAEHVEAFQRDGATCVRGLFSGEELALLARGIERNIEEPSAQAIRVTRSDEPGSFLEDFCNWQRIKEYESFLRFSRAGAAAAALTRSRRVRLHHDHLLVKQAGTVRRTPWHQDQPFYNIDGRQTCSMWLPIDPVPRESTLEFVAASHAGEWYLPRSFVNTQAKWFSEGTFEEVPDVDAHPGRYTILGWALQPGDAVFFHMLTLHAAAGSRRTRRVLSLRFVGDDVRHAPRPWKCSPDFPGLAEQLPAGAELDHPLFPIIYSTSDIDPTGSCGGTLESHSCRQRAVEGH
jgi:ectoine hydroxylase-related dioxygenase (phytanoyl-CoA dioxygenase family)